MATNIQWVVNPDGSRGETWNPVTGCTKTSEGCKYCYAEAWHRRFNGGTFNRVVLHPERLEKPQSWKKKPRMVFINSMSDLFHEEVTFLFVKHVFDAAKECVQHRFVVLTKRPQRMLEFAREAEKKTGEAFKDTYPNVWLGVSVENKEQLWRIGCLSEISAAARIVSAEPLLGEIGAGVFEHGCPDWVIAGAETGPKARMMLPSWAAEIQSEAEKRRVPFFFKSGGAWKEDAGNMRKCAPGEKNDELDGAAYKEMPEVWRMWSGSCDE